MNARILILAAMYLMSPNSARTAEYSLEPAIGARLILDDNIRLQDTNEVSVIGTNLSASTNIGYQTSKIFLQLSPSVETAHYSEETGLEGENLFLDARGSIAVTEKTNLSLDLNLSDEAVGVEEFSVLGSSFEEIRKTTTRFEPTITQAITDKINLQLSYSYEKVDYEESVSSFLNSYNYDEISLSSNYILDSRNQFTLTLSNSDYDVPDNGFETVNRSAQIGWTHLFSDSLSFSGTAGLIYSETGFNVFTPGGIVRDSVNTRGDIFNFSINKKFESSELSAAIERSVTPGVVGDQNVRESLSFRWQNQYSQRLSSNMRFTYYSNETQTDVAPVDNNFDYLETGIEFRYRLSEKMALNLDYRFRTIDREVGISRADSNNINLTINYGFDRFSWAR